MGISSAERWSSDSINNEGVTKMNKNTHLIDCHLKEETLFHWVETCEVIAKRFPLRFSIDP